MTGDDAFIHVHDRESGENRARGGGRDRTVVVGVTGASGSGSAVEWAAQYAGPRGLEVELVHSIGTPSAGFEMVTYDGAVGQAEAMLRAVMAALRARVPGLPVRAVLDHALPAHALTDRSEGAALVVVGAHRRSRVERLFGGTLSYQVAAGSHCPVVVVPRGEDVAGSAERAGGVVVGIDGSADSRVAMLWAADEALAAGETLHVLHAWQRAGAPLGAVPEVRSGAAGGSGAGSFEDAHAHVLAEAVGELARTHPGLVTSKQLVLEQPAVALVEASRKARLVVVGSRGLHGVARMLLGSVSHTAVQHAFGPVMIVRTPA